MAPLKTNTTKFHVRLEISLENKVYSYIKVNAQLTKEKIEELQIYSKSSKMCLLRLIRI